MFRVKHQVNSTSAKHKVTTQNYFHGINQTKLENLGQGSSIQYVGKIFRKTNISDLLIPIRACAYQGGQKCYHFRKFCVRTKRSLTQRKQLLSHFILQKVYFKKYYIRQYIEHIPFIHLKILRCEHWFGHILNLCMKEFIYLFIYLNFILCWQIYKIYIVKYSSYATNSAY